MTSKKSIAVSVCFLVEFDKAKEDNLQRLLKHCKQCFLTGKSLVFIEPEFNPRGPFDLLGCVKL
jgi:hypothetical protein